MLFRPAQARQPASGPAPAGQPTSGGSDDQGERSMPRPTANIMLFGQAISFTRTRGRPTSPPPPSGTRCWNWRTTAVPSKYKADNREATWSCLPITCGYCGKFHCERAQAEQGGSPSPTSRSRAQGRTPSCETVRSVWCADNNPQEFLTNAFNGAQIAAQRCAPCRRGRGGRLVVSKLGWQGNQHDDAARRHVVTGYHSQVEDIMETARCSVLILHGSAASGRPAGLCFPPLPSPTSTATSSTGSSS